MAYDSKCLYLAQYFLGCEGDDGDEQQAELAQYIQDAVEGWFAIQETLTCAYCGVTDGLRMLHDGGGYEAPEYTCEDCFSPQDNGPCFDDLPALASRSVSS